ncbi:hypothetical protein HOY82DRAFT_15213 [Tuber indicum]|nr:hypothetical protein HOY82DRAFT_15213 [Tuber indicum]
MVHLSFYKYRIVQVLVLYLVLPAAQQRGKLVQLLPCGLRARLENPVVGQPLPRVERLRRVQHRRREESRCPDGTRAQYDWPALRR